MQGGEACHLGTLGIVKPAWSKAGGSGPCGSLAPSAAAAAPGTGVVSGQRVLEEG